MLQNGSKILEIRTKTTPFTQEDMAELLNMTQSSYSKIEREKLDVNLETIQKIAKKLETDPKDIIREKEIGGSLVQTNQDQASASNIGSPNNGTLNYTDEKLVVKLIEMLERQGEQMQMSMQEQNKTISKIVEDFTKILSISLEKLPK